MNFKQWIKEQGGPGIVSAKLGVNIRTVQLWRQGKARPSLEVFEKIEKISGGEITAAKILKVKGNGKKTEKL